MVEYLQKITPLPLGSRRPYAGNARVHSKKQIRQIARSIERFGFTNPVLVSDDTRSKRRWPNQRSLEAAARKETRIGPLAEGGHRPFIHGNPDMKEIDVSTKKTAANDATIVIVNDPEDRKGKWKSIGGSQSDNWNNTLANQAVQSLWLEHSDAETRNRQVTATVAAMVGIAPKDELEGMMAAQLIAAHNAAMECYRRAMHGEQTLEGWRENLTQANKLSRTSATLLEALNRHRGKGQQKVTVEHVTIHPGGQAVVGVVTPPGGGDCDNFEEQPHAKQIAHAPKSTLPCPDAERDALPVARHGERALPDARRQVARRTEGQ